MNRTKPVKKGTRTKKSKKIRQEATIKEHKKNKQE